MGWKIFAFLLFLALVALVIAVSNHHAMEVKMDLASVSQTGSQKDLLEMTPQETYRMTIKNALPEIKAMSFLLFILFLVAVLGARFEVVSNITRDILNESFAIMISKRGEKLSALEERRQIRESFRVTDKSAMENVIAQLERSIEERKNRNP